MPANVEGAAAMIGCMEFGVLGERCDMRRLLILAIGAMFAGIASAQAQTFPSRPISIVVPFPAGGPTDALARVLSERMKVYLGQPVIIENVTGAAGTIG